MIVSDDTVSKALAYLAEDPHPVALARKDVTDAENKCRELFARAFVNSQGGAEARKAAAELDTKYRGAKAEEAEALFDLERHRTRTKAAEMLISVWQSEGANARAAERVR